MEKRKIGSLEVSVVGLGCNNFGRRLDAVQTARVLDAAISNGITFFDTADIYGGTLSEEFMGQAMKGRWGEVVLATKFGMEVSPEKKGAKPAYVKQAVEDSLRRLQTDRIDLYQLHTPDPETPIADTLGALSELVREGKVREIGCSNFSVEQLREAEKFWSGEPSPPTPSPSEGQGSARFVSVQNEFSLLKREPENGVIDECERQGIALIPYFPLASGLLTGKYRKGQPLPEGTRIQTGAAWLTDENMEIVEKLIAFAEANNHTILELAISWLLSHRVVASVIAGATKVEQIENNAKAADWLLSDSELAQVRSILG